MDAKQQFARMPDPLVFAKAWAIGLIVAEVAGLAYLAGASAAKPIEGYPQLSFLIAAFSSVIVALYSARRGAFALLWQILSTRRASLITAFMIGGLSDMLLLAYTERFHENFYRNAGQWAFPFLAGAIAYLSTAIVPSRIQTEASNTAPDYFLRDEEITSERQDELGASRQAASFARMVTGTSRSRGLVIGVDGPWGVGKTSFLNLVRAKWTLEGRNAPLVFSFEPLRYAGDADLALAFVRELTAFIRSHIFAPELRLATSRYARWFKSKADFSFLGFSFSVDPSDDSVNDILEDIDGALSRAKRQIVIVIDDLDRLDDSAIKSVLFTVRKGLRLASATYILCYDTEKLVGGADDRENAREFLEKFISVKFSLFVDSALIRAYLEKDWDAQAGADVTAPADRIVKLGALVSEVARMVSSNDAAEYKPLLGDLRKVKRFINLLFLLQVERAELDKTDFHRADLVNLILLHLNYPGLFREIYSRETEGRSGFFSVARAPEANGFKTSHRLEELIKSCDPPAKFLLKKLFDAETLGMNIASSDEAASRSRACFNEVPHRNLESYLNLIVRFIVPERQETFALYTAAADRVFEGGQSVESILAEKDLCIDREAYPHDQFWRVLANRAAGGTREGIFGAIDALLDLLPKYSSVDGLSKTTSELGLSLRDRSIFTLLRLLDALGTAGMPRGRGGSENDFRSFIREQIFGKGSAGAGSIIDRLSDDRRTALGWNDLMLFRLQSSVDRLGRLQYVVAALLSTDDPSATLDGAVSDIACRSMRVLSQEIFSRFSKAYIQTEINFFDHVDELSDEDLLGIEWKSVLDKYSTTEDLHQILSHRLAATRTSIKSFVMYQLSNVSAGLGSGIGCGFYDEAGIDDQRGISRRMNEYVFDVCFGGKSRNQPYYHFVDFCLAHLSSGYFTGDEVNRYLPTREGIIGGFDAEQMRQYWQESGTAIRQAVALAPERKVVVENYVAVYAEHAIALFEVLDAL